MDDERKIIEIINRIIPSGPSHLNKVFESDSEIIDIENAPYLFTMDEFSGEDLFRDNNPYTLGWNVAVGGISDILASGGDPLFYAHAMSVSKDWDNDFIEEFCKGIGGVIKKAGATFIGGDLGKSENWRYTASVIGKLSGRKILRLGASPGDAVYISGRIGLGNLEAALKLYSDNKNISRITNTIKNKFNLRIFESKLIKEYATSCIDTSDGVYNGLNTISEINNSGYIVENLPYLKSGVIGAKLLSLPKTLLFLGGCGEYELLFTIKKNEEENILRAAKEKNFTFYRLGEIIPHSSQSKILYEDGKKIELDNLGIQPRDYDDVRDYLRSIIIWSKDNS